MVGNSFDRDGTIDDLPWASVFDPAANARALSAIQAEGFRAASRLVDRFVRAVEPTSDAADPTPDADGAGTGVHEFERLTRAWWSTAGQFLLRSIPATGRNETGSISFDIGDPKSERGVNLEVTVGESAGCEIWLHNRSADDRGEIRLRVSDLLGHHGDVMPASALHIDPEVIPMPARCSRGVALRIDVAPDVHPDVYRGTLLAETHPDLWLSVTVSVRQTRS